MTASKMTIRIAAASIVLAAGGTAFAVTTESFVLDSADAFFQGELQGTAVSSDGSVSPGAATERIPIENVPVAFCMARRGDTVFIGTGTDGVVYRLEGKTVTAFARTGELLVSSLAFGADGALYAGTLPNGRIYRIEPKSGTMKRFSIPAGAQHIWALYYDKKRGRLIAGTGPEGKVFTIDAIGRAMELYKAEASHVMTLAGDGKGNIYAGTSDNAVVLRIAPDDAVSVVGDFPGNEVTAIDFYQGQLAVAANKFKTPPGARFVPTPPRGAAKGARVPRPRAGSGQLWRVEANGHAEALMGRRDTHFTTVQWGTDGAIYAGGGNDGRIFRVETDGSYSIWVDVEERQVLSLDLRGPKRAFTTGDGAALYRVLPGPPREAIWTSAALDARFVSKWGKLEWRGKGRIELETRSGNTKDPGPTWTSWSKALKKPAKVKSPPGRFIQVRAKFPRQADAVLNAVELFYLPQNQRARVSQVQGTRPPPKREAKGQQPLPPTTMINLSWKVENPDGDTLRYRLAYRQESQPVWRNMFGEDTILTEPKYTWDTGSIPDGYYIVRVDASDEENNPPDLTLRSDASSESIRVDNHPPRIERLGVRRGRLRGRVVDDLGPIARIQMAIDAGNWRDVFPTDSLLDSANEELDLPLGDLAPGSHILAVRAFDAGGNQANREIVVNTER
jgi:outer membrane protein assembly factor BamB